MKNMSEQINLKLNDLKNGFFQDDLAVQFSKLESFIFLGVMQGHELIESDNSYLLNLPSYLCEFRVMVRDAASKGNFSKFETIKEITSTLNSSELDQEPVQWLACALTSILHSTEIFAASECDPFSQMLHVKVLEFCQEVSGCCHLFNLELSEVFKNWSQNYGHSG